MVQNVDIGISKSLLGGDNIIILIMRSEGSH